MICCELYESGESSFLSRCKKSIVDGIFKASKFNSIDKVVSVCNKFKRVITLLN